MSIKSERSKKILFWLIIIISLLYEPSGVTGEVGGSGLSNLTAGEMTLFVEFGGLKPQELYEVYLDGYYTGRITSDSLGFTEIPLTGPVQQIEILEYLHSEMSVDHWSFYQ